MVSIQNKQEIIKLNKDISIFYDKYMDMRTEKFGLTASQGMALLCIASSRDGICVSELKKIAETSKSTLSAILKRLCAKGFVTLETLQNDNRQKRIVPTEKALRVKNSLLREFEAVADELLGSFTEQELEVLYTVQKKVLKSARDSFKNYTETEE